MLKRLWIALYFLSAASLADVQHVDAHGFVVENTVVSAHTSEQVWQALVEKIDEWWPKDHSWWEGTFTIDAQAGGCFCETHSNKSAEHMRIVFVEPGKMLRMSGGLGPLQGMGMYGALDWQLTPTEDGTRVTLTYRVHGVNSGGFADLAPIVAHVQGIQLNSLKDFLNK